MTTVLSLTDVNDFWDVLAILLIVMGPVCGAAVPLILKQRAHNRDVTKTLGAVRDQVQNGHPNPLRDDIDRLLAAQAADRKAADDRAARTDAAIAGLATDVRELRQNHRADVAEGSKYHRDLWHGIKRVEGKLDKHLGQE